MKVNIDVRGIDTEAIDVSEHLHRLADRMQEIDEVYCDDCGRVMDVERCYGDEELVDEEYQCLECDCPFVGGC